MTTPVVSLVEIGIVVMDLVWCPVLPLVMVTVQLARVTVIPIVSSIVVHLSFR